MANHYGALPIVTEGLAFCLDAVDKNCYAGSGKSVTDLVTGQSGTISNNPTVSDGCFNFAGNSNTDTIGTWTNISGNMFCLGVWFYVDNITNSSSGASGIVRYKLGHGGNTGNSGAISLGGVTGLLSGEVLTMLSKETSASQHERRGVLNITIGVGWHYAVFNYNGTTYDIWLDNVSQTVTNGSQGAVPLVTCDNITLGKSNANGENSIDGKIGPMHIYTKRALTDAEVSQNFNNQRGRFGV